MGEVEQPTLTRFAPITFSGGKWNDSCNVPRNGVYTNATLDPPFSRDRTLIWRDLGAQMPIAFQGPVRLFGRG